MVETRGVGRANVVGYLRGAFSRGLTITLPILITIVVFFVLVDFVAGLLDPIVFLFQPVVGVAEAPPTVDAGIALALLLGIVMLVGTMAESDYGRGGLEDGLENAMTNVPGLGAIYTSVDELSTMLIDNDTESFREVKVIEYPFEETYAMAFLTAGSTGVVSSAVGEESDMVTVFLPMAPNPMGGFLVHVPQERVYDVDLTVEEGVQTILSTGVTLEADAVGDIEQRVDGDEGDGGSADEVRGGDSETDLGDAEARDETSDGDREDSSGPVTGG